MPARKQIIRQLPDCHSEFISESDYQVIIDSETSLPC
jgi:hypothetical protein